MSSDSVQTSEHSSGDSIDAHSFEVVDARSAFDALADAIVIVRGGNILFANTAFGALAGMAGAERPTGCQINHYIDDRDHAIIDTYVDKCAKSGDVCSLSEFRLLGPHDRVVWVRAEGRAISFDGQQAVMLTIIDIGRYQEFIQVPVESLELFHQVFNLTPDMMVLMEAETSVVVDVNPTFLNSFGRRREDVVGHPMRDLGIWSEPVFFSRFVQEMKINASMSDVPTVLRTRGNTLRHYRLAAQKVDHASRALLLIIGRDVTEEIAQAQALQRDRDHADGANRAKSEFLANMSHELRTPLNAILGFAEIIRDEHLGVIANRKYREYAADIHHSGSHLLSIIKDILDLSKVESGRMEAALTWVDPANALKMCTSFIERRAEENDVVVDQEIEEGLQVEADERLIKQIAINLLTNAVKFNKPGGMVMLRYMQTTDGGARLSVADTGVGMTAEEIRIAKRPFGQVKTGKTNQDGSGLGLPIVSAFCERLGATMGIQSTPNVGTTVQIAFPPHKTRRNGKTEVVYDSDADDLFLI